MKSRLLSSVALAAALGLAAPAHAQSAGDSAAIRDEMTQMREQMAAMAARMNQLEAELAAAGAKAEAASSVASAAQDAAASATEAASAATVAAGDVKVAALEKSSGWSFEPFGRLQVDAGSVSTPDGVVDRGLGWATEVRRARLGVKGDLEGGFGYKIEADFAGNAVEVTDAILTYENKGLTLTAGQHNNFQGLEELTSSRFNSFLERAAFTDAFEFERRVGLSAQLEMGDALLQGGVFTDNIGDLGNDENNSWGLDGRAVFAPKLGGGQVHLGGSVHYRKFNDAGNAVRFRQRPQVHFTDTRFLNTGTFVGDSETGFGLEAAGVFGPLHVAAEGYWQHVSTPLAEDPTFFGGYAEAGIFLTGGDKRTYKGGKFDRVKPKNPVGSGGIGAIQLNVRYDYLDLVDAGIVGGTQNAYLASLVWTPTDHTRFMINYSHIDYDDAAILAASGTAYGVNTIGMRAQFDF